MWRYMRWLPVLLAVGLALGHRVTGDVFALPLGACDLTDYEEMLEMARGKAR